MRSIVGTSYTLDIAPGAAVFKEVELRGLGNRGVIKSLVIREDIAPNNDADGVDIRISRDLAANPDSTLPDEKAVYKNLAVALTGSATVASLTDNIAADGGAYYYGGTPSLGFVTTTSKAATLTRLFIDVIAEVWD